MPRLASKLATFVVHCQEVLNRERFRLGDSQNNLAHMSVFHPIRPPTEETHAAPRTGAAMGLKCKQMSV